MGGHAMLVHSRINGATSHVIKVGSLDIFMVCTESSGDLLGARLIAALKQTTPQLSVTGVGGDHLQEQGMDCIYQVSDFNVMGLVEVLSQLKRLKGMFNVLVERVMADPPKVVVLVDAPDFNIRFAKALKAKGLQAPVIYYVSPQVWAWREKRAREIAEKVDHMMVLFSFEEAIYKEYGLPTTWVGHPLVDELKIPGDKQSFCAAHGLDASKPLVTLAPGSRKSEVKRLLPVMAQVAEARQDRIQFAVPLATTIEPAFARELLGGLNIPILPGLMRPLTAFADAAVVASGTATLETGLLRTPMVVGYRMKRASFILARMLVKVKHVALVNIVLDKRVVPELIQDDFRPEKILPLLDGMLADGEARERILKDFERLEDILGGGGAASRAAQVVAGYLQTPVGG